MTIIDLLNKRKDLMSLGGVTAEDIQNAEKHLNLHFSAEYKEYVAEFGAVSFYGHELTGISNEPALSVIRITQAMREFAEVPNDWYVIENTHIDDIVFWQAGDGAVYKTAPQTAPKRVFKSLADYISACK